MRVLVVEDDAAIRAFLQRGLTDAGFGVDLAGDGTSAERLAVGGGHDAFVVDLGLPDMEGLEFIDRCRGQGISAPALILSARRSLDERVRGLEQGGDDYVTKPFAMAELVARLRNLTRHAPAAPSEPTRLRLADLELDLVKRLARRGDRPLPLTSREFVLLEYLCRNAGRVVTRKMILQDVWRMYIDTPTNVVDVHVYHLRNKVDGDSSRPLIHTVRGVGYVVREA